MYSSCYFKIPELYKKDVHSIVSTIQLLRASIPLSFYLVDVNNNILNVQYNGVFSVITIPPGNYNINTLGAFLVSALPGLSFSAINGVYSFTSNVPFSFFSTSTCYVFIGGASGVDYQSVINSGGLYEILMTNMANFLGTNSIVILSDELLNFNFNMKTRQRYFWQISNTGIPFGEIFYENITQTKHILAPERNLDGITINITDYNGNFLNFHGVEWMMIIEVEYHFSYLTNTLSVNELIDEAQLAANPPEPESKKKRKEST